MCPRLAVLVLLVAGRALAHGLTTGYLELEEREGGAVDARWRPANRDPVSRPTWPTACDVLEDSAAADHNRLARLRCPDGLAGQLLRVDGPGPLTSDVVARVTLRTGATVTQVLTASRPEWVIPVARDRWSIARDYIHMGVLHIFSGPDHLLFLLGLVFWVRRPRAVIAAEA